MSKGSQNFAMVLVGLFGHIAAYLSAPSSAHLSAYQLALFLVPDMTPQKLSFKDFYRQVFLPEHQRPTNVALHVCGTVLGLALLPAVWWWQLPGWLALAFPLVHALPGLVGHRLFEQKAAVGNLRVNRKDHSPLWFIAANHVMTWQLLRRGFYWRAAAGPDHKLPADPAP